MKVLINKDNSQIRITAPEIVLCVNKEEYWIAGIPQIPRTYLAKDWALVEEEPTEGIKGNLEEFPSNVDLEKEIDKWITPSNPSIDPKKGTISREVYIDCIIVTAKHFYKLGLERKEE